jgi:hypothetical protein
MQPLYLQLHTTVESLETVAVAAAEEVAVAEGAGQRDLPMLLVALYRTLPIL